VPSTSVDVIGHVLQSFNTDAKTCHAQKRNTIGSTATRFEPITFKRDKKAKASEAPRPEVSHQFCELLGALEAGPLD